nr:SoxR reducing system RseC family protein [Peptacetobacter hominis]
MTVSSESEEILVEVDNSIGAKVGDHVIVSMEHMNILKAAAYVYIVPMIALIAGIVIAYYVLGMAGVESGREIISAVIGIVLMAVSYLYLKFNDKKFKESREYIPIVTRILMDI